MDSCQKVVERLRILANFSFLANFFFFFGLLCRLSKCRIFDSGRVYFAIDRKRT